VLTIAPVSSAEYYLGQAMDALDEYYTRGEAGGHWVGNGSEALGVSGHVRSEDIRAVLEARSPTDGQSLVSAAAGARRQRAGFDFTFSAPKGVSLIGLLGDRELSGAVMSAHRSAVAQALGYLEREATFVRKGRDGVERHHAGGLVAAEFVHVSSRAGDPQLHSHVLVANLAQGPDDTWSAPCARTLYRHSRTAGFLYQAALRAELTESLGLTWRPVQQGMAEPAKVPGSVLKHFSRRRAEIEEALEQAGTSSARSANVAAHATRAPKDHDIDRGVLVASWRLRAESLGLGRDALRELAPGGRTPELEPAHKLAEKLLGPEGLTKHKSTFSRQEVLRALADAAPEGSSVAALERLSGFVLADPRAAGLAGDRFEGRWSTEEMLRTERELIASATAARDLGRAAVSRSMLTAVLSERPGLSDQQADAVTRLAGAGEGLSPPSHRHSARRANRGSACRRCRLTRLHPCTSPG
jgi:conjugative relaxase-like TrwC/TraI family protein